MASLKIGIVTDSEAFKKLLGDQKMIKLKIELNKEKQADLILWLDGEFQTIFTDSVEGCIHKAYEIQKAMPVSRLDITHQAILQLSNFATFETVCLTPHNGFMPKKD